MPNKKITIFFCGGHLSPALAVMEKLDKNKYEIIYIGRKQSQEGDPGRSFEESVIRKMKIPYLNLITGRLQRSLTRYTLISLIKFPVGLIQSLYLLLKYKPVLVVSFGGYVSLPVCLAAKLLGKKIVIHEQTHALGLTNKIVAKIADKVFLSWPDTKNITGSGKTVVTGNPVRSSIFRTYREDQRLLAFGDQKLPLLCVVGGSQGARSINMIIIKAVPQLAKKFRILHQCGSANKNHDFKVSLSIKNSLPAATRKNYFPVKQINPEDIGAIFQKAELIVSRAGANTVAEIAISGTPAILIPLPWSAEGEQEANAKMLAATGLAKILPQKPLSAKILLGEILDMWRDRLNYINCRPKARELYPPTSADKIAAAIEEIIKIA